jgi:DNA-binding transcriptional regulator YiaG
METKYQSEVLRAIHEEAVANFEIGAITEAEMREYDRDCLAKDRGIAKDYEKRRYKIGASI